MIKSHDMTRLGMLLLVLRRYSEGAAAAVVIVASACRASSLHLVLSDLLVASNAVPHDF